MPSPHVVEGYDDPSCHLPALLGQQAPIWPDGGRAILWHCPVCQQGWYEQGRFQAYTLVPELQACLREQLHVVGSLPSALCPLCAALTFGGWPRIEVYCYRARGYRLFWEQATAPQHRFLACVYASAAPDTPVQVMRALSDFADLPDHSQSTHTRTCLRWLTMLAAPEPWDVQALSAQEHNALQRLFPARAAQSWCGYAWRGWCPPLRQEALLVLAVTSPEQGCALRFLLTCWRQIAFAMDALISERQEMPHPLKGDISL